MKRPAKKVATDRRFVVALSRGLDVLRAFRPNDGLLGNQEIAARTNLPKPTVSRLTYTLTKLGYLTPVPRFEKYQLAPSAMALGYAALANLGLRHLSEPFREALMREAKNMLVAHMPYKVRVHTVINDLLQPWVRGYWRHPFMRDGWCYVGVDRAAGGRA